MDVFAVGTVWFFLLVIAEALWLFACVEGKRSFLATATLVGTLVLLQFLGDVKVFTAIYESPLVFLASVAGYICVALCWSVGKWAFFVRRKRHDYDRALAEFRQQYPDTSTVPTTHFIPRDGNITPEELEAAKKRWLEESRPKVAQYKPSAMHHKEQILVWAMFWPWSMVWTLVNDPVKEFFEWLITEFQGLYQKIADWGFRGADDHPAA